MSFVRVQLIARHVTHYELPFCEIDRCLHFTDTSTRVGGEAGGVVVGDNGLDDDDLQEGSVSRLFAQLRPQKWTRVFQYTLRTFFFFSFLV